jgi:signal transduction histidine kinase
MNTTGPPPPQEADDRTLARLREDADAVRAEVADLRQALGQLEHDFRSAPGTLLREVNEQLVRTAMRSHMMADPAPVSLQQLAGSARQSRRRRYSLYRNLCAANEQLVLAAVHAQEIEDAAEQAHRRQIAFLATVAHELRNPLMPLRLAAELLGRAQGDGPLLDKLRATITGQVAHIARLVDDLLDGARVSTGKFGLERSTIDLSDALRMAVETCMPVLQARGHRFTSALPALPLPVDADPMRLVQVFSNLLENAAKYTPPGGNIWLQAEQRDGFAEVAVADDGIGIGAEVLPRIFDLFVQDPQAGALAHEGLGIGLAVVRELVEAHGGTVQAESAGKGLGSRFVVRLPLQAAG